MNTISTMLSQVIFTDRIRAYTIRSFMASPLASSGLMPFRSQLNKVRLTRKATSGQIREGI
jgi:hypothetical protein